MVILGKLMPFPLRVESIEQNLSNNIYLIIAG